MKREEAEALLAMAEREWFRGAEEHVRRGRARRLAQVLDLYEGEIGFDEDQLRLGAPLPEEPESDLPPGDPRRRARRSGPATSLQAAESIDELRERQRAVHEVLETASGGMTDEQLVARYAERSKYDRENYPAQSESGLRTRRHELVELGFARDSGHTREIRSGRQATVWRVTEKR